MKGIHENKLTRIFLFNFIIIAFSFSLYSKSEVYNTFSSFYSEITIKVIGSGNQRVFSSEFNQFPDRYKISGDFSPYDNTYELELEVLLTL